ncbi:MAG: helix-turn-helix domain-containing protein [Acidimicrobiia bacterium]|nr:helix-turn-helix domain-containing protein [bacterium]MXW59219.1 helix-turn-helix domain-containing protein [Acidimicrobiia bacterium]MDE0613049.1 helix-turn-helix domain-containing protein [bacterium]MXZ79703.1 helix-turn-helix domain-containing protein [Acidimicrobiia bacterium]MXZ85306.1 helix-turn-helix domain-containing protein [Acidimicrobiia bacterium]
MSDTQIVWLNTETAAKRLGITTRTLYRFINEGGLPAYRMGRVIRVKQADVDAFIERSRIEPGTLGHLYPDPVPVGSADAEGDDSDADSDS